MQDFAPMMQPTQPVPPPPTRHLTLPDRTKSKTWENHAAQPMHSAQESRNNWTEHHAWAEQTAQATHHAVVDQATQATHHAWADQTAFHTNARLHDNYAPHPAQECHSAWAEQAVQKTDATQANQAVQTNHSEEPANLVQAAQSAWADRLLRPIRMRHSPWPADYQAATQAIYLRINNKGIKAAPTPTEQNIAAIPVNVDPQPVQQLLLPVHSGHADQTMGLLQAHPRSLESKQQQDSRPALQNEGNTAVGLPMENAAKRADALKFIAFEALAQQYEGLENAPREQLLQVVSFANDISQMVNSRGLFGQRTADLLVDGIGQIDVYSPVSVNTNSILRTIENKNSQASGVLVQTGISEVDMAIIAARTWGKPTAQNIQIIFFQKPDASTLRFNKIGE